MIHALAGCRTAVMASRAGSWRYASVRKSSRHPRSGTVTGVARRAGDNMICTLTCRGAPVVAGNTCPRCYVGVREGRRDPCRGAVTAVTRRARHNMVR